MNRNQYPVLSVCERINGHVKGSGDGISPDEMVELYEWLVWRTSSEGWTMPMSKYDDAVFSLAHVAMELAEIEIANAEGVEVES